MSAPEFLLSTNAQNQWPVHRQRLDGRSSDHRATGDSDTLPPEVIDPDVTPWVEETYFDTSPRVAGALPGPLSKRTRNTSQRQILSVGRPERTERQDVVDVEGGFLTFLREAAVLAAVTRSLHDKPAKPRSGRVRSRCRFSGDTSRA